MGSGTSRSSLTREECKQRAPEGKWDEYWDDFYFADGKSVSSEIAERVWCKAERWAAHVASTQAAAEPKNGGTMESVPESPREGVRDSDEGGEAAAARERSLVARARWKRSIAHAGWAASLHAKARRRAKERAALDANATEALDERWAVIESDFERVVPQKDGRYAPEEGNLEDIKEVISRAVPIANQYYEDAWAKCQEKGDVDAFLALSAALAADFTPAEPPKCALPADSSIDALIELASRHGRLLLESLAQVVQATGGEYTRGPRKSPHRIQQKAENDYGNELARVVDVERATGIFDSADDLSEAISVLRGNVRRNRILIRRCKDHFGGPIPPGYRDLQFNIEREGFVGELQMNLRQIVAVKEKVHKVYEVVRWMAGEKALAHAADRPGLESEPVLRLTSEGDLSVIDAFGSIGELETALKRVLPQGFAIANVDIGEHGDVRVSLSVDDVAAAAKLRDAILLDSRFEEMLNEQIPSRCVHVDRGAFVEYYATLMMRFTKLTQHQRGVLEELRAASVAVLLSPAGGGKTFLAIQRLHEELQHDLSAVVLFVARNAALALFACKWLVASSRKAAERVVERVHVLVAPFEDGPQRVSVVDDGGRKRLKLAAAGDGGTKYALVVVDEAHHLLGDAELHSQLEAIDAATSKLLFLGDASQAATTLERDALARLLVDLPQGSDVAVSMLSEVVRSTKRIVAGAAAFQLAAGRKAETETHAASVGPPLVARIFNPVDDVDAIELYAVEVFHALSQVQADLAGLSDLDDRVAVVGPDEAFVEKLRGPLELALGGFELVDAATASAALPRDEERSSGSKPWLVADSIGNMDGLERLVVICVGLDQVIDCGEGVMETRSRLYRAMTRAQLAVAVVNESLPGGWLEFLGSVELDADGGFDEAAERGNRAETAADDVVGAVLEEDSAPARDTVDAGKGALEKVSPEDTVAAPEKESGMAEEAPTPAVEEEVAVPAAEKKDVPEVVDADPTSTPLEAKPMKVLQSIWDARAVTSASRGDLRFMPFPERMDLSTLATFDLGKSFTLHDLFKAVRADQGQIVAAAIQQGKFGISMSTALKDFEYDTDPAPDYGGDVDGWTNTEYTFGNEHWTSDDGETYSLCPMEPGETLLEAARREKKYTVVNWLQSITMYGARYCEKCGHEYCRFTYSWEDLNMDHGLAGDDITYHHCNRSGSTWPPGEGPETKPKDSEESDSNFSSDSYHYEMGCCKCRGFWGKSAKDLVSDSWGCITKPGPNGTRVKENAR